MPTNPPKRRVSPEAKAQSLLRRFPIVDLAKAVSLSEQKRRNFLTRFVTTSTTMSYAPTREAYSMIYAAQGPLIESAPETWQAIETHLKSTARPDLLEENTKASRALFDFVRPKNYVATQCDIRPLKVSLLQAVNIDLGFYVTDADRLIFQYPLVRRECMENEAIRVLASIVSHAYVQGDFAAAEIEIADISCLAGAENRCPRIRSISNKDILDRPALNKQIENVYAVLSEIAQRPPRPPDEPTPMGF